MVAGGQRLGDPDSSLLGRVAAPGGLRATHRTEMSPRAADTLWSLEKRPRRCTQHRRREVPPPAAEPRPSLSARCPDTRPAQGKRGAAARGPPPAELWVPSAPPRGQRQGPECAASLRSHVSRRRRLKMTPASWHRGESWTPGSRRSGAEARLSLPAAPLHASPPEVGGPRGPAAHAARFPAARPPSPLHSQASAFGDASWGARGTSSRSLAAPPRAGWGTEVDEGEEGPSLPPTSPETLPAADQSPDPGTLRGREWRLHGFAAQPRRPRVGRPRCEARELRASWGAAGGFGCGRHPRRRPRPAAPRPAAPGSG